MSDNKGKTETIEKSTEPSKQKIDSLLPPAKIHLFSEDLDTLNLAHALAEDWRFARVNIGMRGDNLDQAISYYSRRKSPTLIIIQTDETDGDFEEKLAQLADMCEEGTAAIVVGPVNDIQLYRHLTSIGVSDYLVAPMDVEDTITAIAHALQNIVGSVDSHLMAFVGVKGGVGTSSIASMSAQLLSDHFQEKTLIIDAAGANSTLWNQFGFAPSGTLIEAARAVMDSDTDALARLIIKKSDTLHVLNSGTENILDNLVVAEAYEMLLDYCLSIYPYVVIDTSSASRPIKRMVMSRANSISLIATPRVPDLSIAKLFIKSIKDMPGSETRNTKILINKVGIDKSSDIKIKDVCNVIETNDVLQCPYSSTMFASSENSGEPLYTHADFESYKEILIPYITQAANLQHFKQETKTKTDRGLLSGFKDMLSGGK